MNKIEWKNIRNKIPFLATSIFFGILSVVAQGANTNAFTGTDFAFLQRLALASHSYLFYIAHLLFPFKFSAFYPYPHTFNTAFYFFIPFVIIIFSVLIYLIRNNKIAMFSMLFFTLTVIFLLQIIPVGDAMLADRYTYLPSIGILILIVLSGQYFIKKFNHSKLTLALVSMYIIFLAQATFSRTHVWKDGISLWTDVIQKYPKASIAYTNRGATLYENGNTSAAMQDFSKAIEIDSANAFALYNAALIYYNSNDFNSSLRLLNGITEKDIDQDALLLKAFSENKLHDYASSDRDINIFLSKNKTAEAHTLAGLNNIMTGNYSKAKINLNRAIELDIKFTDAYVKRGVLLIQSGDTTNACSDWQKAASLGSQEVDPFIKQYCR